MDDFVWLRYPLTGGVAAFNPDAAEIWIQRGWEPCDPPGEEEPKPVPQTEPDVRESKPASRRQTKEQ